MLCVTLGEHQQHHPFDVLDACIPNMKVCPQRINSFSFWTLCFPPATQSYQNVNLQQI